MDVAASIDWSPDTALIVVDMQNDFAHPEGSLFVAGGDTIVECINELSAAAVADDAVVVLTQDWHPESTPHFEPEGRWPVHCVGGTWGAELVTGLDPRADAVIRKGTGGEDGYSAFTVRDPVDDRMSPTGLGGLLRERGVEQVVVVGLAADVCVAATAQDAAESGFDTTVIWDATRAVDASPDAIEGIVDRLRSGGVTVTAF